MSPINGLELSIVIPFYNEEECVEALLNEIKEVMATQSIHYELVAVDDGSSDSTYDKLRKIAEGFPQLKIVALIRNYGQTSAMAAGFDHAVGKWVLPMDGDGQNDPNEIPKFLNARGPGVDLISGWRKNRSEKDPRRTWPSKMANYIIRKVTKIDIHDFGCSMKLYRRYQLKDVHLYGEMHRFIPVFVKDLGGKVTEIEVNHRPRSGGQSKYGLERTFKVMMDLFLITFFVSVKDKPIYLFGGIGFTQIILGFLMFLIALSFKVIHMGTQWGWWQVDLHPLTPMPSLPNVGMFLMSMGVLTILIGLLADLSMRTYYESQNKKPYHLRRENDSNK